MVHKPTVIKLRDRGLWGWVCPCGDNSIRPIRTKETAERMTWLHRNRLPQSGGVFDEAIDLLRAEFGPVDEV